MIILYCEICGMRVSEKDITSGTAKVDAANNHTTCAGCMSVKKKESNRAITAFIKNAPPRSTLASRKTLLLPAPRPSRWEFVFRNLGIAGFSFLIIVCVWEFGIKPKMANKTAIAAVPAISIPTTETPGPKTVLMSRVAPLPDAPIAQSADVNSHVIPAQPAGSANDNYDPRAMAAGSMLQQAKDYYARCPHAPWTYKEKLEDIIKRYKDTPAGIEAAKVILEGNFPSRPALAGTERIPEDAAWVNAVEILPSADPAKDSIRKGWNRKGDFLVSSERAWMTLPYKPTEEYDLRMVFARQSGIASFVINLPRSEHSCTFALCHLREWSGFEMIRGKWANEQPGSTHNPDLIQNGKTYVLTIQVRSNMLKAWLDGKLISECAATAQEAAPTSECKLTTPDQLAVGAYNSVYEVRSLKIIERAGQGAFLRSSPTIKAITDAGQ